VERDEKKKIRQGGRRDKDEENEVKNKKRKEGNEEVDGAVREVKKED
jgi:hypothetical protein